MLDAAFPGPLRDQLVSAILSGEKTSTTSLLTEYEIEVEELSQIGERRIVVERFRLVERI
jgi:uncharacterized protein YhfF